MSDHAESNHLFPIVTIVLLYAALHLYGIVPFTVGPGVKVAPVEIQVAALGFLWLTYVLLTGSIRVTRSLKSALVLCGFIFLWMGIQSFRSQEPLRALTLLFIMVRDLLALGLVAVATARLGVNLTRLNRALFAAGVFLALVSIGAYLWVVRDLEQVIANPRPGLIYWGGEAFIPHLQGFTHNPIYLGLLLPLPLLSGLLLPVGSRGGWVLKWAGCVVLLSALGMTFSRGAILALVLSTGILLVVLFRTDVRSEVLGLVRSLAILLLLSASIALFVELPAGGVTSWQRILYRFRYAQSGFAGRYESGWNLLVAGITSHPLLGQGLRAAELNLGGQFSENSYLEILYDTGLIGLALWLTLLGLVTVRAFQAVRRNLTLLPWVQAWVILLLAFVYASIHFDPLIWIVAGVLLGSTSGSAFEGEKPHQAL